MKILLLSTFNFLDTRMIGCHTNMIGFTDCDLCKFPFIFNGKTHYNCTTDIGSWTRFGQGLFGRAFSNFGGRRSWCSTRTFANGKHMTGYYGYCKNSNITIG